MNMHVMIMILFLTVIPSYAKSSSDHVIADNSISRSHIQSAIGIGSFIILDRIFADVSRSLGWTFPSSLAGMVTLFVTLCVTHNFSPKLSESISTFLCPAVALLKVWLPLFFVPPLVILPTKAHLMYASKGPFSLIIVGGLLSSLMACGVVLATLKATTGVTEGPVVGDVLKALPSPTLPSPYIPLTVFITALMAAKTGLVDSKLTSKPVGMSACILGFIIGTKVPEPIRKAFAHPVITCAIVTILLLNLFSFISGLSLPIILSCFYGSNSNGAGDLIASMLGPAVISFGLQLYQYRGMLQSNIVLMSVMTVTSALFGLFSSAFLAGRVFALSPVEAALAPLTRCITTPLALAGSRFTGGDPSLAAFFVVITGILGASFGERILASLGVTTPVAVGTSLGAVAHGLGAASVASDPVKFAAALVSMTLTGLWTVSALCIPRLRRLLLGLATKGFRQ